MSDPLIRRRNMQIRVKEKIDLTRNHAWKSIFPICQGRINHNELIPMPLRTAAFVRDLFYSHTSSSFSVLVLLLRSIEYVAKRGSCWNRMNGHVPDGKDSVGA
ncbi:hypothetical protein CEXT_319331 [Caerostris extrusa]|uniref:Uncharacterized protein n=1 Tax=Caerostris extrusa TaxID=172846 RepID=A0AAV4R7M9_CAEEX|nr:hypothetical protein CEXT_319331 [Caerostris extrusa]